METRVIGSYCTRTKDLRACEELGGHVLIYRYASLSCRLAGFHICAQKRVDSGLVSASMRLEPFDYIAIHAERQLRLAGFGFQATPYRRTRGLLRKTTLAMTGREVTCKTVIYCIFVSAPKCWDSRHVQAAVLKDASRLNCRPIGLARQDFFGAFASFEHSRHSC